MLNINAPDTLTILKIHGSSGNLKINKSDLFTVLLMNTNITQKIKCDRKCIVTFKCSEGDIKQKDELLCVLSPCTHEIVVSGFCGLCSMPVEIQNFGNGELKCSTGSRLAMLHSNKNVVVKKEAAIKISLKDYVGLLKKRKLSLLVDLDSTILHSTDKLIGKNFEEVYSYTMKVDQNSSVLLNYHTKFRPYLKKFLTEMNEIYEMHIYTFGNKFYAEKIAEFIDPDKKFFGQRIISKDDSFDPMKKSANLKSLFPRGDNMVCIIDDRTDVWNNAPNCIHVQPYLFFPETGDINDPYKVGNGIQNVVGKSEIEKERSSNQLIENEKNSNQTENGIECNSKDDNSMDKNEDSGLEEKFVEKKESESWESNDRNPKQPQDPDCYLLSLANILKEIHTRFYEEIDKLLEKQTVLEIIEDNNLPDVKLLMKEMRMQVLRGCRVSFSGLIPLNQKVKDTYEYHMLTSLGGEYLHNVSLPSLRSKVDRNEEYTTHLVCKSEGTKKMKQVAQYITEINRLITLRPEKLPKPVHTVHLVKHDWLWQSFFFWQNVNEIDFTFLSHLKQLPVPERFSQNQESDKNLPFKMPKKRKSPSVDYQSDLGCKILRIESEKEDVPVPVNEDDLKELDGIENESLSGISTNSLDDSVESYTDKDVPLDNLILHYSLQEQMDMFNEVDEAMDEEKCEKLRSPESSDYYNSDSSSSSSGQSDNEESDDFQKPPRNWEKENDSNSSNSNDEHEIDYADLEESCDDFGLVKDNVKSDFDEVFDDFNF